MSDIKEMIGQIIDVPTRQALGMANHYIDEAMSKFSGHFGEGMPSWAGGELRANMALALKKIEEARARSRGDAGILTLSNHMEAYVHGMLGIGELITDKPKKAIESLEKSILIVNNNVKFYKALSDAYLRLGDKNKALEYAETASSIDPDDYALLADIEKLKQRGAVSIFLGETKAGNAIVSGVIGGVNLTGKAAIAGVGLFNKWLLKR